MPANPTPHDVHDGQPHEAAAPLDAAILGAAIVPPDELERAGATAQDDMTTDMMATAQARRMLQFIAASRETFPNMRDLADHPGWEFMLHIFIAMREGRAISTTQLCDQTGCWRPLANRYAELLFEREIIDRDANSTDKADAWPLRLTPATDHRLTELLCRFAGSDRACGPRAAA